MRLIMPLSFALLVACTSDESDPIKPDPTGSGGAPTSATTGVGAHGGEPSGTSSGMSSATSSGVGGTGGSMREGGGYESGSRLKARYYAGADGSKQFVGWRDTQLNTDCDFRRASDDKIRCTPNSLSSLFFSDAACTVALLGAPTGCAVDFAYLFVSAPTTCPNLSGSYQYRVFAAGAAVPPPVAVYYLLASGTCTGGTTPAGYDYYAGQEVPASMLVEATEMVEP